MNSEISNFETWLGIRYSQEQKNSIINELISLNLEELNTKKHINKLNEKWEFVEDQEFSEWYDKTIRIEKNKKEELLKGLQRFNVQVDYYELAKHFIKEYPIYYDENKIWWLWNFKLYKWEIIDETDILISVKEAFQDINTISSNIKSQIIESLRQAGRKGRPKEPKKSWIQFKETIVDIETGERMKASPKYFITNPIPHNIGNSVETPTIDKLFVEWVGEKYKDMLYEILAYSCLTDYPIHRLFCFTGSGRNGKSKYLDLITRFVGKENTCSASLDRITKERFETIKLYKKLICQMGETNFNVLNDTEQVKRLTGQDLISFEFKGKNGFDDYNYAKILIATNTLPATKDKTIGFYSRWLIIDFPNQFKEKNGLLSSIPQEEYENLAFKTISILKDLLSRPDEEKFTNEGDIQQRMDKYEERSNPLENFIKLNCCKNPNLYIFKYELRDKFEIFCKQRGFRKWNDKEIKSFMIDNGYDEGRRAREWYANETRDTDSTWTTWEGVGLSQKSEMSGMSGTSGFSTSFFSYRKNGLENGDIPDMPDILEEKHHKTSEFILNIISELTKNPVTENFLKEVLAEKWDKKVILKLLEQGIIAEISPEVYQRC